MGYPIPSKEQLTQLYVGEKLTTREIGKQFGVSRRTIGRWLRVRNVPSRHPGRPILAERRAGGRVYIWKPEHPRAHKDGYVHRSILVWEQTHGRPLPDGWDVHHVNGIKDDDRPKNLLALSHGKHSRLSRVRETLAKKESTKKSGG
jgi:hypothetical protein